MSYLLDTCAISELEKRTPNENVIRFLLSLPTSHTFISSITVGEIQRGITQMPDGKRRLRLESFMERQLDEFAERVLPIDREVGRIWGELYATCQMKGYTLASSDSLIAATAIHHGLHVVTRNIKDFAPTGVLLINPWEHGA